MSLPLSLPGNAPGYPAVPQSLRQDAQQSADRMPTVDLAPLADLIERQAKELADLREAAAIWQVRARQAEEQLKQLMAGNVVSDNAPQSNTVDAEGPQLLQESDPGPTGVLAWWKRLWGD